MKFLRISFLGLLAMGLLLAPARGDEPATQPVRTPAPSRPENKNPERHAQFLKDKQKVLDTQLVFLGDSITDFWRLPKMGKPVWDANYEKFHPLNLGIAGDRTQHVLWRIEHDELDGIQPKVLVLLIGTNNLVGKDSPDDIAAAIELIVEKIQNHLPQTKVLLLAIFPRGDLTGHQNAKLKAVNTAISQLDDGVGVRYLDIGDKFLDAGGEIPKDVMGDRLHPSTKGYQIWADAMAPLLAEMMK